uniref:Uncharacterized protein n=1 Tax=Timema tahoe TaxID=61484 RepID=A0A7R9I9M1_9NEOP|nr:unnamed protein product [Timema tahoe]
MEWASFAYETGPFHSISGGSETMMAPGISAHATPNFVVTSDKESSFSRSPDSQPNSMILGDDADSALGGSASPDPHGKSQCSSMSDGENYECYGNGVELDLDPDTPHPHPAQINISNGGRESRCRSPSSLGLTRNTWLRTSLRRSPPSFKASSKPLGDRITVVVLMNLIVSAPTTKRTYQTGNGARSGRLGKVEFRGSEPEFAWRESGKHSSENHPPVHPNEIRTSDLPVLGSLTQHETSALPNYAAEINRVLFFPVNRPALYVASPTLNSGYGKVNRSGQYWQEALQFSYSTENGSGARSGKRLGSNALASQLYRSSSFNSSGRSSTCDTADDMYSDVSLEEDVLDLNHKRGGLGGIQHTVITGIGELSVTLLCSIYINKSTLLTAENSFQLNAGCKAHVPDSRRRGHFSDGKCFEFVDEQRRWLTDGHQGFRRRDI